MCAVGGGGSPGKYGTTVRGINETGSPLGTEEPGAHVREHDWSKRGEERRKRERERIYLAMCTSGVFRKRKSAHALLFTKSRWLENCDSDEIDS